MSDAGSPAYDAEDLERSAQGCRRFVLAVVAVPLLGAGAYFAYEAYSHQKVRSEWTVDAHEWRRTIAVTTEGTWTDELWCTTMKQQFPHVVAKQVTQKHRGSKKVKTGETCTGQSTNRASEKRICHDVFSDQPVMDDWCVFTWTGAKETRKLESKGGSVAPSPHWPAVELGAGESEGERTERYVVTLKHAERERTCEFKQERWAQMQVGTSFSVEHKRGSRKVDCSSLKR